MYHQPLVIRGHSVPRTPTDIEAHGCSNMWILGHSESNQSGAPGGARGFCEGYGD